MSISISKSAKYYDGRTGNPQDVSLHLTSSTLRLMSGDEILETWSMNAITVVDHPAPPVPGIFGHNKNKDARIYIDDAREWRRIYDRLPRSSKKRIVLPSNWSSFFLYTIMSVVSLYFLFLMFPRIVENAAYLVPIEAERTIGKQVVQSMTKNTKHCIGAEGTQALHRVFHLMKKETVRDIDYQIYVVENDFMPNAFAAPGGYLVIFSDIIERAETPEEVFGVLAHEIAHVDLYHTTKGIVRDLGMRFIISMIVGGTSIEDVAGFFSQMNYSREDESEADLYGRTIMVKAGINPKGMRHFFENIKAWEDGFHVDIQNTINKDIEKEEDKIKMPSSDFFNNSIWEYLSTHSNTDKRIKALKALEKDTPYRPILSDKEWQSLKDICSKTKKIRL